MMIKNTNENVNEAITEAETTVVTAGPTTMIVTGAKLWNFDTIVTFMCPNIEVT